jgi:pilus assembly protein Flp/PilA
MQHITKFLQDEEGATAIEYGLIAGLVAVAIIAALSLLGTNLGALFGRISTRLTNTAS